MIAAFAALGGTAWADDGVIRNPPWRTQPPPVMPTASFPQKAVAKKVRGKVVLQCRGGADGHLEGCVATQETPVDFGFADAAVVYAGKYLLQPKTADGRSTVGATIELPIYFAYGGLDQPNPLGRDRSKRFMLFNPHWDMTPSHQDMANAWTRLPAGSAAARIIFDCSVLKSGHLDNCEVINTTLPDAQYAKAAEPLLSIFHVTLKPGTIRDQGLAVQVPINLRQPDPPPADPNTVRMVSNPNWISAPSPTQVAEAFPAKAATAGLSEGKAGLECMVDRAGLMSECEVAAESPEGMGFGEAAKKVASSMGIIPWTDEGEPVEGAYIDFAMPLTRAAPGPAGADAKRH